MNNVSQHGKALWRVVLFWNVAFAAAGLLLLELTFGEWLAAGQPLPFYVFRKVEYSYDCSRLYPGCSAVDYARDHWGLRGAPPDPARIEVLTVGGSTTDQRYVPLPQTWQAVLASEFLRLRGRPLIVANAGLDGLSTVGHVHSLEHWFPTIPGLRPRIVIYFVGVNDQPFDAREDHVEPSPFLQDLKERSGLVTLARRLRGWWWARQAGIAPFGHEREDVKDLARELDFDAKMARYVELTHDQLDAYGARLRRIAGLTRSRLGAEPVFMTQASAYLRMVDPPLVSKSHEKDAIGIAALNDALLATCRANAIACVDLAREVAFDAEDFYDNCHTTPRGSAKIGTYLARKLAAMPSP